MNPQEDMVYYHDHGKVMSGGYKINSLLLKNQEKVMTTKIIQNGGNKISAGRKSNMEDLAIPPGLLCLKRISKNQATTNNITEPIKSDLYERLLQLVENKPNISTRKSRRKSRRKSLNLSKRKTKKRD